MKSYLPLVLGVIAISSCVASSDAGVGKSEADQNIFYRSQAEADAALEAFDKANPTCELWTNWQKMCSRTGLKGETHCVADPAIAVKPSTPFCANRLVSRQNEPRPLAPEIPETLTEGAGSSKSRNRFCSKFWNGDPGLVVFDADVATRHKSIPFCTAYKNSRPFNGLSASSQENPRCKRWAATRTGMYYCAETITDAHCRTIENGITPPVVTEDGILADRDYKSEWFPVWGLSCVD